MLSVENIILVPTYFSADCPVKVCPPKKESRRIPTCAAKKLGFSSSSVRPSFINVKFFRFCYVRNPDGDVFAI